MPRRLNYTGRRKIKRNDVSIRLHRNHEVLTFAADIHLADYGFDKITPPPLVYVEAYRGASALWKRFDFGHVDTKQAPDDCSLDEFGVPEGILFRVKVSASADDALGRLLGEADGIRPRLPDEQDDHRQPLIQHMATDEIGDELWRVDFEGEMPLLLINKNVPMGFDQFLRDPNYRAVMLPAVMRQVLTRILIIDRDTGDEDNPDDWRQRWMHFATRLPSVDEKYELYDREESNLQSVEEWINSAVESFGARSGLLVAFARNDAQEDPS